MQKREVLSSVKREAISEEEGNIWSILHSAGKYEEREEESTRAQMQSEEWDAILMEADICKSQREREKPNEEREREGLEKLLPHYSRVCLMWREKLEKLIRPLSREREREKMYEETFSAEKLFIEAENLLRK